MCAKQQDTPDECVCLISEVFIVLCEVDPSSKRVEDEERVDVEMEERRQGRVEGDCCDLVAVLDRDAAGHCADTFKVKEDLR